MSSCGAGRGRGWLNLSKNAETPKPGGLSNPLLNNTSPVPQINSELCDRIREINLSDDGILFNKKMQHVQAYWLQDCHTKEDIENSFEQLYKVCLYDTDLASKLVTLIASRTFVSQEIHDCNIRHQFLKHLQRDFENSNQLQTTNSLFFRNCVLMLGEFYSKARSQNGEPYTFLAAPFILCLELLLNSKTLQDIILFTNQIFLNGSTLKSTVPEEIAKLGVKIRSILVSESHLVRDFKLWLLLSLDLFNVRFGVLPHEVFKYYEDQLGSVAMINFQKPHDPLSIQTVHSSKILDSYQSNVNVLQISTSPTEAPQNDDFKNKEKPGRPILGSGARFIKKGSEENGLSKTNGGRIHVKKNPANFKSHKGWEHDDRFENDYNQ